MYYYETALSPMHPKHLTTPERYGAGMAHTITFIVNVPSWSCCGLLWIIDYHGLSWTIMDYLGLSLIIIDSGLWWTMVDYHGLCTIMDYHGLMGLIMDYGPSWTIVDYSGTLWIIVGS